LKALFVQVLALCAGRGMVDLSAVAVDGSPMRAAAARSSNRGLPALQAMIADGDEELDRLTAETDMATTGSWLRGCHVSVTVWPAPGWPGTGCMSRRFPRPARAGSRSRLPGRMVARAEQRLAGGHCQPAGTPGRLRPPHAARSGRGTAARQRAPAGRGGHETKIVRQQARLARAQAALHRARNPQLVPPATAGASLTDPASRLMLGKHADTCRVTTCGSNAPVTRSCGSAGVGAGHQDRRGGPALGKLFKQDCANATTACAGIGAKVTPTATRRGRWP
jgi:hypothetical protein